jgi:hypothetical protein
MVAATKDRDTQTVAGETRAFPMVAAAKAFAGTIAAIETANGNVKPGLTATNIRAVGVFSAFFDNSAGAAGAVVAEVKRGVFGPFANSSAGDLIAAGDVDTDCYIVDDQTVAKTSGGSTRTVAGKVHQVDAAGVWVRFA